MLLTSTTVDEGLEHLRTSDVECVVSDYMMPDRDGIEFLEAVRSRAPNLPFILYTSNGSEDIASNAISAGVTDYLQKGTPNQYSILANRIEHAIVQYRSAQELERKTDLLETAQEIAGLGAWELDVRADEWWFSEEVRELIARSPDNDVPRDQLFEFYNPDDEQRMESAVEEAVANAEPF
ncbi:MAG: response regulator [Natrialbaceae archaeon]|nr:response regulator [Natrialbaceae archaeon]